MSEFRSPKSEWKRKALGMSDTTHEVEVAPKVVKNTNIEKRKREPAQDRKRIYLYILAGIVTLAVGINYLIQPKKEAVKPPDKFLLSWSGDPADNLDTTAEEPVLRKVYILANYGEEVSPNLKGQITSEGPIRVLRETCEAGLPKNGICEVVIEVRPQQSGPWRGKIFAKNAPQYPIFLSGKSGTNAGSITFEALDGQNIDTDKFPSDPLRFTARNTGGALLSTKPPAFDGARSPFEIQSHDCPERMPAGAQCNIRVRLKRDAASGQHQGVLRFSNTSIPILATAKRPQMTYEEVFSGAITVFRINNKGNGPYNIENVSFKPGSGEGFVIIRNTCEKTVDPNESCEVQIQTPLDGAAEINLGQDSRKLTGYGPRLVLSGGNNFVVNAPKQRPDTGPPNFVTIQNQGRLEARNIEVSVTGPFTIVENPCQLIGPGRSCRITLVAKAENDGRLEGNLSIKNGPNINLVGIASNFISRLAWDGPQSFGQETVFRLTNNGPLIMIGLKNRIVLGGPDKASFAMESLCENLVAGQFCDVRVRRTDRSNGLKSLVLEGSGVNIPQVRSNSITGPGRIELSTNNLNLDLPNKPQSSVSGSIVIKNVGGQSMPVNMRIDNPQDKFSIKDNTCAAVLASGSSCEVTIEGKSEQYGIFNARLLVENINVPITLKAELSKILEITAPLLTIDGKKEGIMNVLIQNTGGLRSEVISANNVIMQPSPNVRFTLNEDKCLKRLNPSESCTISYNVLVNQNGPFSSLVTVYNATARLNGVTINLSGLPRWSPLNPGTSDEPFSAFLINAGQGPLNIPSITSIGEFNLVKNDCPQVLAPEDRCLISWSSPNNGTHRQILRINDFPDLEMNSRVCRFNPENIRLPIVISAPNGCNRVEVSRNGRSQNLTVPQNERVWMIIEEENIVLKSELPDNAIRDTVRFQWK